MASRADIRADFIKRLFAVAISIGVATSFVGMDWVKKGSFPTLEEMQHLAVLFIGIFATVLSWDGYLASIDSKPHKGGGRFTIDIILVFIYMFLLISSEKPFLWLPLIAIIFCFYVWWDALTVREHIDKYDKSEAPAGVTDEYRASLCNIVRVYARGTIDAPTTERGPIITLSWAIYFVVLACLNLFQTARYQVFVMCGFAFVGLWL
jgi:hypothetical protein